MKKYMILCLFILVISLSSCNDDSNDKKTAHIQPKKQAHMLFIYDDDEFSVYMEPVIDSISIIKSTYVTVEKICADSEPWILDSFNIRYLPHIIVFDTLGNTVYTRPGQYSYSEMNRMLRGKIW